MARSRLDGRLDRARPKKKTRIEWNESERLELLEQIYSQIQQFPDQSLIWHANEAQKKLSWPIDRRRKIATITQVVWVKKGLISKFAKTRTDLQRLQMQKTPPPPPPPPKAPTASEVLEKSSTAEIAAIFFTRFFSQIDVLQRQVRQLDQKISVLKAPVEQPTTTSDDLKSRPVIAVIGVGAVQQQRIEKEFGKDAKFKFYDGKSAHGKMPTCDHAVIMVPWASRTWYDICRGHKSKGNNVIAIQVGGMRDLMEKILEILT